MWTGVKRLSKERNFIVSNPNATDVSIDHFVFDNHNLCISCGLGHYDDVIVSVVASQITSLTIVYSTVYPDSDQRKHQSSVSLAFVWGIHRGPVNSPHKWPVTRKMSPLDDVIMVKRSVIWKAKRSIKVFNLVASVLAVLWRSGHLWDPCWPSFGRVLNTTWERSRIFSSEETEILLLWWNHSLNTILCHIATYNEIDIDILAQFGMLFCCVEKAIWYVNHW